MGSLKDLTNLEELNQFERAVNDYLNLQMDADRFTAARLQQGVYGQRQEGVNMVRIKLPGGRLDAPQLRAISDILEQYSQHDVVHITTRQDIQAHYVPLEHTPAVLRRLASAGLTTREACGNTIRNVTSCALSGVCPREHVDVNTHLDGAVAHFLRNPLTQQMPRKFKISFSACEADCAQGLMHDLGVVAVKNGDRFGFKVMAGGGLGHKPHEAIIVEEFVEERDLLLVMEAIIAMHNKYSDRVKRAKARIKFLVDRFGAEGFLEKYREEFARTKAALAIQEYPQGEWRQGADGEIPGPGAPRKVFAQRQPDLCVVPISVPMGNLNVAQLRGLAALMDERGFDQIRVTQDQNMMLANIAEAAVAGLIAQMEKIGFGLPKAGDDVVACPGTSTCRLGITSSTVIGPRLDGGAADLRVRVSGCHNGCAQPETGDIGIYGEGRRLHGKLVPHYQMYFGGDGMGGGHVALKGPSVPSARIEVAIERVKAAHLANRNGDERFFVWARRLGQDYFKQLLADLVEVRPEEVESVLRDHGYASDFKVLQLGGGECAGASQVQIGSAFFDAAHEREYRDALKFQRKFGEAAKCAEAITRLIGQGVSLLVGGEKIEDLAGQAEELRRALSAGAAVQNEADDVLLADKLAQFAAELARPAEELNDAGLTALFRQIDDWTQAAAEFSVRRDRQLDLSGALPKKRPVVTQRPQSQLSPA